MPGGVDSAQKAQGWPGRIHVGNNEWSMMSIGSEDGHGNSPAAWTAVIIMLVAFAIGTLAFWFNIPWIVYASAVLLVVGVLTGVILARLGYGVNGEKSRPKETR